MIFRHGSRSDTARNHSSSFVVVLALLLSACGGAGTQPDSGSGSGTGSAVAPSTGNISLSVTLEGSGTVTTAPGAIECTESGGVCNETYASGVTVQLTAAPATDYDFIGWSGTAANTCTTETTCSTTLTSSQSVKANFRRKSYGLTVSLNGSGSVASAPAGIACGADCSEAYASGTSVTLAAAPGTGYIFGGWSGACAGTGSSCTLSMTAARSVAASFTAAGPIVYQISWDPVIDARVTGYKIYYSTAPLTGAPAPVTIDVGNVTTYSFNATTVGVAVGSTLYVAVTSVGDGVESELSETVTTLVQ